MANTLRMRPVIPQSRSQNPLHHCPADSGNEISHTTELAVCASLLNFVLLVLESGPLYLFFVNYFIIIIICFFIYCVCALRRRNPGGLGYSGFHASDGDDRMGIKIKNKKIPRASEQNPKTP